MRYGEIFHELLASEMSRDISCAMSYSIIWLLMLKFAPETVFADINIF